MSRLSFTQAVYLTTYYYHHWFAVAAVALLLVSLTWPSPGRIDPFDCKPTGVFASLSAEIYGETFWQAQLPYLQEQAIRAKNWDSSRADRKLKNNAVIAAFLEREAIAARRCEAAIRAGDLTR